MLAHIETGGFAANLSPAARAAVVHALSMLVWGTFSALLPAALPAAALPWAEGGTAALIGAAIGLPRWWLPINALFFPAIYALLSVDVPPAAYLAALALLLVCNVGAWSSRVPLFLSTTQAAAAVTTLLPRGRAFRLLDLGCGTGSFLMNVSQVRPDGRYTGVEIAPLPWLWSRLRAQRRDGVEVVWGDFWQNDLSEYDVVYAYLSPAPMARLWEKARAEMRPGSLFISNDFAVPGMTPQQTIRIGDRMRTTLYVWTM